MTPEREILGITVRTAWEAWAREQPDVADHPEWLTPWGELPDRIKEVDARIGEAVLAMFKIPPVIDSKR